MRISHFLYSLTLSTLVMRLAFGGADKHLFLVQIVPSDSTSYTVNQEMDEIGESTAFAIEKFRNSNPRCSFKFQSILKIGSEPELFGTIQSIARNSEAVVVGFSRSTLARIAAKAAEGSKLIGISIGASTDDLRRLNPRFVSVASPWTNQWDAIKAEMQKTSCFSDRLLVVEDSRDSYSSNFGTAASLLLKSKAYDLDSSDVQFNFEKLIRQHRCIFLAMNISTAHELLTRVIQSNWNGNIFGTGDWYYYFRELSALLKNEKYRHVIINIPTGWDPSQVSVNSRYRLKQMTLYLGHAPSPIDAYSYDAATLAIGFLCKGIDPAVYHPRQIEKLHLFRQYSEITSGGNYVSAIRMIRIAP